MDILVIGTCYGLYQPKSGGRNRFYNLVQQLNKKNDLNIIQPAIYKDKCDESFDNVSYYKSNIGNRNINTLTDFNPYFILKVFKTLKNEKIDLIQISQPFGVFILKIITKLMNKNVKIILDSHNVEKEMANSIDLKEIKYPERIFAFLYTLIVPLIEQLALKCSDIILVVSEEDKSSFIKEFKVKSNKIALIPSGIKIEESKYKKDSRLLNYIENIKNSGKSIVFFHGSYFHPPNREAIEVIKNYIAPRVSEAFFIIAGTDVPIFNQSNIKSLGFIEDIYSLMQIVDIAIVPICNGGGTRLKILDYMMMSLPIVTTKKGIEGINAINMENALIVEKVEEEFIDSIRYLLKNKDFKEKMGKNNRKLVEEKYNIAIIGDKLNELYNKI